MPVIQRVCVHSRNQKHVIISTGSNDLPEDKNWKSNGKPIEGTHVLFDRVKEIGSNCEHVYACVLDSQDHAAQFPILFVEINNFESNRNGQRYLLHLTSDDSTAKWVGNIFESEDTPVEAGTAKFRLFSRNLGHANYGLEAPFGFWGNMQFHLVAVDSSDSQRIGSLNLEFYCLSSHNLPSIFDDGIPLLLLRMFVAALGGQHQTTSIKDWITLVVGIVHGSRLPFSGEPCKTYDHWLRYESDNGMYSFTSPDAGGIDVQAWLDAYTKFKTYGMYTKVNCYDQAAITEVALSLGICHRQIHWEYHQVYGFIREVELVGWGPCNNPYFKGNVDNIVYANPRDPKREPFRNHAYLSWTLKPFTDQDYKDYNALMRDVKSHSGYLQKARDFEQAKQVKMLMIDSCAGPHNGTESREEYESTIELILNPATSFSDYVREDFRTHPDRWQEEHSLSAGITKLSSKPPTSVMNLEAAYAAELSRMTSLLSNTGTNASTDLGNDEFRRILRMASGTYMEGCYA